MLRLNYAKLANVEQEEKEAPGKFLDRLQEALHRFTKTDPESEEGRVILKDRFFTQSAPDICCKLLKQAYGPNQSLDNLLQLVHSLVWQEIGGEEGEAEKTKEQAEGLITAVRTILRRPEKSAQRDPGGKAGICYYCGKEGHLTWNCPQASKLPLNPCPACKDHTGGETAPRGIGPRGQTLRTIRTEAA